MTALLRLNKAIAMTGYCSRRQADDLIRKSRIFVNNRIVKEMGIKINPAVDKIRVKGGPLLHSALTHKKLLIALHKPKGYICTKKDRFAKHTVYDLLPPEYQRLFSIGRLDKDTEGLLLFTNDGELAHTLTHPQYEKEKTYIATCRGRLDQKSLDKIRSGISLRQFRLAPAKVKEISFDPQHDRSTLELIIKEGKKRQVREMFLALKHPIKKLVRISCGPYELRNMKPGDWRKVKILP